MLKKWLPELVMSIFANFMNVVSTKYNMILIKYFNNSNYMIIEI